MYKIHLKFAKEFISEIRLNEKSTRKNPISIKFFVSIIGLKGLEHLYWNFTPLFKVWMWERIPLRDCYHLKTGVNWIHSGNRQCKDSNKLNFSVFYSVWILWLSRGGILVWKKTSKTLKGRHSCFTGCKKI